QRGRGGAGKIKRKLALRHRQNGVGGHYGCAGPLGPRAGRSPDVLGKTTVLTLAFGSALRLF
ncbi:MAG: hypothetical protein K2X12_15755, partial [Burkholderiaceae bacterium]|nr:hypothetical protein [Burkholderiaceae bacterium]